MHFLVVLQKSVQVRHHGTTATTQKVVHRSTAISCFPMNSVGGMACDNSSRLIQLISIAHSSTAFCCKPLPFVKPGEIKGVALARSVEQGGNCGLNSR